jgi:NAD(P)-dependent dehydrogenase (short-subunit alcohol dehydrogenase family)
MKTTAEYPVVLITGALAGIGRATAIAFGREGARVVVSGRRKEQGLALEAELHQLGTEAAFIHADVRQEDDLRRLVDQTVERFGRLDFAAGVPLKRLGRPEEIAETILFVASDKASFISGASIPVNGGKAAL